MNVLTQDTADFDEEAAARRRVIRRRIIIAVAAVVALALLALAARPTGRAIKGWQARRHAQKAFTAIEQERWADARTSAVAAFQLRQSEPQAVRAVARFLSRTRQPQALEFWDRLRTMAQLTRDDLRDEAAVALATGEMARADAALGALLDAEAGPRDWVIAAQAALQKGAREEAQGFVRKVLDAPSAGEREQLQAAVLQLASGGGEDALERAQISWDRLKTLAAGTSSTALDALLVLAQQALRSGDAPAVMPLPELASAIEAHPLAKAPQKLLALDLLARANPADRSALIDRAVSDWSDADAPTIAALATWLNGKGEYQRTLDAIPLEKALQSADIFLQHLDALGALGRWADIKQLLDSERYPLDPVIQRMYLARTNAQLGEKTAAQNNWQRAMEAANDDPQKLVMIGDYAQKNGVYEVAAAAFERAAMAAPKVRGIQAGRLRAAQRSRDTKQIHTVLAQMLEIWPNDAAVRNDEAYLRLLLLDAAGGQMPEPIWGSDGASPSTSHNQQPTTINREREIAAIEQTASELVAANPASLPHRTLLALARLKQGRAADALAVYAEVQVTPEALTSSALAVHAAVLHANGEMDAARSEAAQIQPDQLLPEERLLLTPLISNQ